ncbi:PAS domain-containing sensor histidine kinase [Mesobacillus selenatarsenatis]|uniref:histidine kinase n=1 Tax=Mesobacillus selenatarsenatis TaxID=388741 RepID=A0A846TJ60_9BACI|nr:PAS domain-containing sensor histidine kinase [Mesobacillus selenatarsenatis]NKE04055.1 PAS domain S-box protein [Mesobacillus selenatarsenatis]
METAVNGPLLFENIFNHLTFPVVIFEIDHEASNEVRVLEVNETACSLFKYSREEFLTKKGISLFNHLSPRVLKTLKTLLFKNDRLSTILELRDKTGQVFTVEINASFINQGSKPLIFCMLKEYSSSSCENDAVREENRYLRMILDTTQSFVLILDKDGRIYSCNQYTERMTGYSLKELQYQKFWDIFIESEEKGRISQCYLSGNIPLEYQNSWLMKNGKKRHIKWKTQTVTDADGNTDFVLATGVDVTDEVLSYKELDKSRGKYQTLVSSMNDLVFTIDRSYTITSVYGKWLATNGFTKEAFEGKSIDHLLSDCIMHQKVKKTLGGEVSEFEWELGCADKIYSFHTVLSPIVLHDNTVREIVGVTRDITEKKSLEEHHKRIYEALTSGVIVQNTSGEIIYVNKNSTEILGYSEHELKNMTSMSKDWEAENSAGEAFPGEEHPAMKTLRTGEGHSNVEMFIYNPEKKEKRWILVDTRPIFEAGSYKKVEYVLSTFLDITKKKEMDEVMQQAQKHALVGKIASGVVHEIRNPLTSLMGFLKLFEEGDRNSQLFDYLPVIKAELEQLNKFANEFIELSNTNEGKWAEANLIEIINDAIHGLKMEIDDRQINISIESDYSESILLFCNEPDLKLLFINLFENSIEAMDIHGNLQILVHCLEEKVMIKVIDNGKGISPERLKHLCEPYYSTKEKGTGLGLMRSLKIINDHKGKIDFSSEVGQGTVVTIELFYQQQ